MEARIERLRKQAASENSPAIARQIEELESALPNVPALPRIFSEDITPERLASMMQEQNGRMAVFSDEGGIFDLLAGRYSNGTVGISPQPDVLASLRDKPGFRGRGLLARFLYALPQSRLGYRTLSPNPIPSDISSTTPFHEPGVDRGRSFESWQWNPLKETAASLVAEGGIPYRKQLMAERLARLDRDDNFE